MTLAADGDDRWLHRLIFEVELTEDQKIHPAAWERFKPAARLPQWTYVLSGTSWKLGKESFLRNVAAVVDNYNLNRHPADHAAYRGLIHQVVQHIRDNGTTLGLDVQIVQDPQDPAHSILVTTVELKNKVGSVSPEIATQLNQLFVLELAGSPEENQLLV